MKLTRRILAFCLAAILAAALALPALASQPGEQITILFTHDMHSHFLPALGAEGEPYGGFAQLKTAIDRQRQDHPDALLLDGGDFSMGSLFQTAYSTSALELRAMGAMGYDATTLGNHEYDYRAAGLADMLNAAVDSGDPLPALVEANYLPPAQGEAGYDEDAQAVWDAFARYGVEEYILLERGGVWYVIFGLMGFDSDECAPMSGMELHDPVATAQRVVEEATAACVEANGVEPVVICLSHSGTEEGKGEDYELAREVDGIDVIISGHTHTVLSEPVVVEDTYIVSAGEYTKNLGVLTLDRAGDGTLALAGYELIPVDTSVEGEQEMAQWIEEAKVEVEENYLSDFDLTFDQVLTYNPYTFDSVDDVYATAHESTLGNLLSDAYRWAAQEATGQPVDVALTASGVIRESFPQGNITVSDAFNVASLGIGADGVPGYPLVAVYLTGADLKNALEVDASVYPLMSAAQLFFSGVEYSFNTSRMIFNKVDYAALRREGGTTEPIVDDRLYRVVTGLYCGQMLGAVESSSFGLLTVVPRQSDGTPIDMNDLEDYIVHDSQGREVKEWHAVATYLQHMGEKMGQQYGQTDGRKQVYSSLNPINLLHNANKFTVIALVVLVVLILAVVLVARLVVRRVRRGPAKGKFHSK